MPGRTRLGGAATAGIAATWAVALGLLLLVVALSSAAPQDVPRGRLGWWALPVGAVAVTAQAGVLVAALVLRRLRTAPALVLVCSVAPVAAAAGLGAASGVTSVTAFVAAYALVVEAPWPRPVPALAVGALLVGLGEVVRAGGDEGVSPGLVGAAVLQGLSVVALGAVVGAVVGARRETTRARIEQVRAMAGEQAALTEAAVARQRAAMARELHDIAAHHLSGIAVMTAALDRQIDTDPAGAKVAVRQVRQQSTAMLRDLRHLVALLRDDDLEAVGAVEPETLGGLPQLVGAARDAGRDVELSVLGAAVDRLAALPVGPLAQLAAYRTVQEALANAARHAPGARCEVVVDARDPAGVVVTVSNDAPAVRAVTSPGGGFGIVGMRERADLTDAELQAGPTPDGGFRVRLALPTSQEEDAP